MRKVTKSVLTSTTLILNIACGTRGNNSPTAYQPSAPVIGTKGSNKNLEAKAEKVVEILCNEPYGQGEWPQKSISGDWVGVWKSDGKLFLGSVRVAAPKYSKQNPKDEEAGVIERLPPTFLPRRPYLFCFRGLCLPPANPKELGPVIKVESSRGYYFNPENPVEQVTRQGAYVRGTYLGTPFKLEDADPRTYPAGMKVRLTIGQESTLLEGYLETFDLIWAGDIDGDGKLDFALRYTDSNGSWGTTLFLSTKARQGELVGAAASTGIGE